MTLAPPPLRIAIAGAAGRMGQALARTAGPDFAIVGGTEQPDSPQLGRDIGVLAGVAPTGAVVVESAADAARQAEVWLDFTRPTPTLEALARLETTDVKAAIIGTTGFSADEDAILARHAGRLAIVKSGNFSLGVNLLQELVEQVARRLGPTWDIEIAETHHRRKVDAPSGTALMLADAAARGRGAPLDALRSAAYQDVAGPRQSGAIGFSVSRSGGVIGDHAVAFGSDEEMVVLSHRALDRALFARGALVAAQWARLKPPGLYSMRDVLGF